jgi:HSP20 family protein
MLPVRWDTFRDLSTLRNEIDSLFRRSFGALEEPEAQGSVLLSPRINTFVKDNRYQLEAELPGITREDIDISVDGNILTLSAERQMSKEVKEQDFLVKESSYGSFMRRLALPEGVDTDKIHAKYDNGILTVTMPIEKKLLGGRKVLIEGAEGKSAEKKIH